MTLSEMHEEAAHRFPLARFSTFVILQAIVAIGIFAYAAPRAFALELRHPLSLVLEAALFGIPLSLFEYLYHRYLLHSAIFPYLSRMHAAHREHHDLTYVKAPVRPAEPQQMVPVRSEYPVEEAHQEESMMFPWYALSIFYGIFLILLGIPTKLLFPHSAGVLAVITAVTVFYCGYELWHAALHLPYERYWEPLMTGRRTGRVARYIYSFHLMHHWRPTANLAVVGLWGAAVWDHLFRTHRRPLNLPMDGSEVNFDDARLRKPLWPVSQLDRWQPAMYKWSRAVEQSTRKLFHVRSSPGR